MPVIQKQNSKPVVTPKTGILGRMVPVSSISGRKLKIGIYGRVKTGKTRLLSTAPKPVAIIGAEDGTASIGNVKDVDFIRIVLNESQKPKQGNYVLFDELPGLISELRSSRYETVGLDTASSFQDILLAHILGLEEVPTQKKWGMATLDQYRERSEKTKQTLQWLLDLPKHVVITAHEMDWNEETKHPEIIFPDVGFALSKSPARFLNGSLDYICQTFIREGVSESVQKINGQEIPIQSKNGQIQFCLRIGPHDVFQTGFRVSPGIKIPDVIVSPSFQKIQSVIDGTYKP